MASFLDELMMELSPRPAPASPAANAAGLAATMGLRSPAPAGGPVAITPGQMPQLPVEVVKRALAAANARAQAAGMQPPAPRAGMPPLPAASNTIASTPPQISAPSPRLANPVPDPAKMMTPARAPTPRTGNPVAAPSQMAAAGGAPAPVPASASVPSPARVAPAGATALVPPTPSAPVWDDERRIMLPGPGGAAMQQGGLLQVLASALRGDAPMSGVGAVQNAMSMGSPSPGAAPAGAPAARPAAPSQPGGGGQGVTGTDVASFFRNLFGGAAAADPRAPALTAFAQGGYGAMAGRDAEREKASKQAAAAEETQYKRGREAAEDQRAAAADRRAARKAQIDNATAVSKLMRQMSGDLTPDQRLKLEDGVREYAKTLNPDGLMDRDELEAELDRYRQRLESQVTGRTPATPAAAPAVSAQPGGGGDGSSRAAPAKPTDRTSFDALPSGAWFINPSDGRLLQKK